MAAAGHRHGRTVHRLLSDDRLRLLEAARGNRRAHAADRSASQSANRETGRRRNCSANSNVRVHGAAWTSDGGIKKVELSKGGGMEVKGDELVGTTETKPWTL